ncbi:hypothetical protein YYE_00270 [Plasmodium vinckei vinckei]|nr:hypothetical protein YYE_00270 [Plasmodium vinckei vinckei]
MHEEHLFLYNKLQKIDIFSIGFYNDKFILASISLFFYYKYLNFLFKYCIQQNVINFIETDNIS